MHKLPTVVAIQCGVRYVLCVGPNKDHAGMMQLIISTTHTTLAAKDCSKILSYVLTVHQAQQKLSRDDQQAFPASCGS